MLKPWTALVMPTTPTPILGVSTPIPLPLPTQEATALVALVVTPSSTALPPTPTLRPTATFTPSPSATPSPLPTATPTTTSTPEPVGTRIHVVASGDNLGSIAVAYDVDTASIATANNIKLTTMLRVGQELIIPAPTAGLTDVTPVEPPSTEAPATATTSAAPTSAATDAPTNAPTAGPLIHIVQSGDILGSLAVKYGVDVDEIAKANNIRATTTLRVGQELIIPGLVATPTLTPPLATPTAEISDNVASAITNTTSITGSLATEATPTPRPTYEFAYLTPPLLGPVDRSVMLGAEADIVLNWASVGILSANQWYMVTFWPSDRPAELKKAWTRATSWRVPLDMYPGSSGPTEYSWQVKVVRRFSEADDGIPLSPPSVTYHLTWK